MKKNIKLSMITLVCLLWVPIAVAQTGAAPSTQSAAIDQALLTLLGAADIGDYIETRRSEEIQGGFYQVRTGDTLDVLIRRMYGDSAIRNDILRQAIIRANPHAFRNNNPNWMLAGARLRIPQADDVMALIFTDLDAVRARIQGGHPNWVRYP
jgi:Tfp pilus assembly protein FimV